jgi:hypothetical protein
MAMATKRAMVTNGNGNTMDNGHGEEGGGCSTVATMLMGKGTAQRTRPLALQLERRGMMVAMGNEPWFVCVCFFLRVERPQK